MHDLIRGMATLGHHDVDDSLRNTFAEASTFTRVIAELFPTTFDKQLAAGVAPEPGSVLAAHVSRWCRHASDAGSRKRCAMMSARPTHAVPGCRRRSPSTVRPSQLRWV